MSRSQGIADPVLERQARRMFAPALRFLAIALIILIPGIVLVIVGHNGWLGLGIALILISSVPGAFAFGLLVSSSLARWTARHKLFA